MITEWLEKTVGLAEALVEYQLEDYKEFTEICLLYLDNVDKSRSFKVRRPGAIRKAGWSLVVPIWMVLDRRSTTITLYK